MAARELKPENTGGKNVSRSKRAQAKRGAPTAALRSVPTPGNDDSPYFAGYQHMAQQLLAQQNPESEPLKSILVAGSIRGEGASTVARALAHVLSKNYARRTILVDANLRTPIQHEAMGVERAGGVSEIASDEMSADQAIKNPERPGPALLTCGRPSPRVAHLLNSAPLRRAIGQLTKEYDWVILDAPPVTTHPDAAALVRLVDGGVLVARADWTRREVAQRALTILQQSGGRVLGVALNRQRYYIPNFIYRWL